MAALTAAPLAVQQPLHVGQKGHELGVAVLGESRGVGELVRHLAPGATAEQRPMPVRGGVRSERRELERPETTCRNSRTRGVSGGAAVMP